MPFVKRSTLLSLVLLSGVGALALAGFVYSGAYDVGADDAHTRPVLSLLQTLRDRSIAVRANQLTLPALDDAARIRQGAGNYDAMCTGCHLAPGVGETEMSKGLYPTPPNLTREQVPPREAFWVIKHGIKASGMPAWGKSMEDEYIWNMVAFLQALPSLDEGEYTALVERSGGHSHGGGESRTDRQLADGPEAHGPELEERIHPASASTVPEHGKPGHHH